MISSFLHQQIKRLNTVHGGVVAAVCFCDLVIIGLYNLETNIENTAMMQVSTYHKKRGDKVELYIPAFHERYDKIYAFSIFNFTPRHYIKPNMICGGTGFNVKSRLPKEIEDEDLDYSIFPKCRASYIWFSRGCVRKCPFCVVPEKEGIIHPVKPKNLNPKGKYITVMDNNFFANPEWREAIKQLQEWGQPVDFQGVDARLLNKEMCDALNSLSHYKRIKIAWDNPREDLIPKLKEITQWVKPYKLMCYVLIGYWSSPEEDLYRVETLRSLGIDPFVMPFNKHDLYQSRFGRWVNRKAIFKSVSWANYKRNIFPLINPRPQ